MRIMRMKGCWLGVMLAMLLITSVALAEDVTTLSDEEHVHYAVCTAPNVCAVCGEPYIGSLIHHNYPDAYEVTSYEHSKHCLDCGELIERGAHYAICTNPGVCWVCGVEYTGDKIEHDSWSGEYIYVADGDVHYAICPDCNQEVADTRQAHYAACTNPGVCVRCGVPYTGDDILHDLFGHKTVWDEKEHYDICTACGNEIPGYREEHYARCTTPDVCARCGAPYTGDRILHTRPNTYSADENGHFLACTDCGQELANTRAVHYANCVKPDVCAVCGVTYTGQDIRHTEAPKYVSDDTNGTHYAVCMDCGQEMPGTRDLHWADCAAPGVCHVCGVPYNGSKINHHWPEGSYRYTPDGDSHYVACDACGQEIPYTRSSHTAYCTKPDVCADCGAPYAGDDIEHVYSWPIKYTADADVHYIVCAACGEVIPDSVDEHFASCVNPGVCAECGAAYAGENVIHGSSHYVVDGDTHYKLCEKCGKEIPNSREEHRADCFRPNVCRNCGVEYENAKIEHTWSGKYVTDGDMHYEVCASCGQTYDGGRHYARCDKPDVCIECGAAYSGQDIRHDWKFEHNETEHWAYCTRCGEEEDRAKHSLQCGEPDGVCTVCGAPYSGNRVVHYSLDSDPYLMDETGHWKLCGGGCGEEVCFETHTFNADGKCSICGYQSVPGVVTESPTEQPTDVPTTAPTDVPTTEPTDAPTDVPTTEPTTAPTDVPTTEPTDAPTDVPTTAPTDVPTTEPTDAPTDVPTTEPTDAPTDVPTTAPTDVPTTEPTDAPTDVPTTEPTEVPTTAPTDAPHEHVWTVTAKTPATCEEEGVTAYSCACGESKFETVKALGHNFADFISQGDGTHRSDCTRCSAFTAEPCELQSQTVNGISCQLCSICGYTVTPALTAIELPETPMAGVIAVTTTGEAASILVFDVTASLTEDSTFALCLQVMPPEGVTLSGGVRITIPCTLDTTGLRLVFIPEDGLPVDVPYGVGGGMITFTVTAPGVFALVPIQE